MTIGEKIKYYREQLGITQDKLAKLTGIHPVSIRKYETNKMQPQSPQIEKIAAALSVSYNALNGMDHATMRFETVGDLIGILIVLLNSNVIAITGERGEDHLLKEDTVSLQFNPLLSFYLEINYKAEGKEHILSLKDAFLNIKDIQVFQEVLNWEKINFLYQSAVKSAGENPSEEIQSVIDHILEDKEKVELELQKSQILLDKSNGISVKINPDYNNS